MMSFFWDFQIFGKMIAGGAPALRVPRAETWLTVYRSLPFEKARPREDLWCWTCIFWFKWYFAFKLLVLLNSVLKLYWSFISCKYQLWCSTKLWFWTRVCVCKKAVTMMTYFQNFIKVVREDQTSKNHEVHLEIFPPRINRKNKLVRNSEFNLNVSFMEMMNFYQRIMKRSMQS